MDNPGAPQDIEIARKRGNLRAINDGGGRPAPLVEAQDVHVVRLTVDVSDCRGNLKIHCPFVWRSVCPDDRPTALAVPVGDEFRGVRVPFWELFRDCLEDFLGLGFCQFLGRY